jgi:hypothetical protein
MHEFVTFVFACGTVHGRVWTAENFREGDLFFRGCLLLLGLNILVAFLSRPKYLFGIVFAAIALPLQAIVVSISMEDACGIDYRGLMQGEFYGLIAALAFQIALWYWRGLRTQNFDLP